MKSCLSAKKYLCAVIYLGICIVSSLYHLCKWGPVDGFGYGGYCIEGLSFQEYFVFDFFFSQMTIPACASFFINPKKAAVEVGDLMHTRDRKVIKNTLLLDSNTNIQSEYTKQNNDGLNYKCSYKSNNTTDCGKKDYLLFKYVDSRMYVEVDGGNFSKTTNAPLNSNDDYSVSSRFDSSSSDLQCGEEFDAIEVKCSHCDCNIIIHKNNVAIMNNVLYYKIASWKKTALANLENFYLVFHVLVISTAIKVVGTSIVYITLPLVVFNLCFVLLILIQSYSVEKHNKPMEALDLKKFTNRDHLSVDLTYMSGEPEKHTSTNEKEATSHLEDHCISMDQRNVTFNDEIRSGIDDTWHDIHKKDITKLMPFCKSLICLDYMRGMFVNCFNLLTSIQICKNIGNYFITFFKCCCIGCYSKSDDTISDLCDDGFERKCERRYPNEKLKFYEHLLGFNLIRSVQWSLSINGGYCCYELTKNKFTSTIFSLAFAIIAVVLFSCQHFIPKTIYWFTHSIWHILGALGQYIIFSMVL